MVVLEQSLSNEPGQFNMRSKEATPFPSVMFRISECGYVKDADVSADLGCHLLERRAELLLTGLQVMNVRVNKPADMPTLKPRLMKFV